MPLFTVAYPCQPPGGFTRRNDHRLVWDRQGDIPMDLDQRLLSQKPRLSVPPPPDYFSLLPVLMANMAKRNPYWK